MDIKDHPLTKEYHIKNGMFSIPFFYDSFTHNSKVNEFFLDFVKTHHEWIHDIYFTPTPTAPFDNDSMGLATASDSVKNLHRITLRKLKSISKKYNIPISATFNDTSVLKSDFHMAQFIENFRHLYDEGIRNITLSPTIWMNSGAIKRAYPDLYIKNTVLHRVKDGQMFWYQAEMGYDYINIDRELMRNEDALKDVKKAQTKWFEQTGKYIPIALLANEGCRGKCPVMDDHYSINQCSHKEHFSTFFKLDVGQATCPKWSSQVPGYKLKQADIIYEKDVLEHLLQYVDVFKFHGRTDINLFQESIAKCIDFADMGFAPYTYDKAKWSAWKKFTRTCKFQCYDCNLCDDIALTEIKNIEPTLLNNNDYEHNPMSFNPNNF
jgi:hypothetical protein